MADAPQLLPCPFCGGAELHIANQGNSPHGDGHHWVECDDSKCGIQGVDCDTIPEAIERWNTRAALLAPPLVSPSADAILAMWQAAYLHSEDSEGQALLFAKQLHEFYADPISPDGLQSHPTDRSGEVPARTEDER